jgi:hypothetical protein
LGVEGDVVEVVKFLSQSEWVGHQVLRGLKDELSEVEVVLVEARVDDVKHDLFVLALEV